MCILLYVKLILCNASPYIYFQLEWGVYICPQYMCILLYVIVIWCDGISDIYCLLGELKGWVDVSSVYMNSDICDTYLV